MIIGIAGVMESGKTTTAQILQDDYDFHIMSFSSHVKKTVALLFDLSIKQLYTPEGKATIDPRWGMTPRKIMQLFGTEAIRGTFGDNFWVKILAEKINVLPSTTNIVIDDVRFISEAKMVLNMGGRVWRCHRKVEPLVPKWRWLSHSIHPSERPLPLSMVDHEIWNTKDKEHLRIITEVALREVRANG